MCASSTPCRAASTSHSSRSSSPKPGGSGGGTRAGRGVPVHALAWRLCSPSPCAPLVVRSAWRRSALCAVFRLLTRRARALSVVPAPAISSSHSRRYQFGLDFYFIFDRSEASVATRVTASLDYSDALPRAPAPGAAIARPQRGGGLSAARSLPPTTTAVRAGRIAAIAVWRDAPDAALNLEAIKSWGAASSAAVADFVCFVGGAALAASLRALVRIEGAFFTVIFYANHAHNLTRSP